MRSKANFWKAFGGLALIVAVALSSAGYMATTHQRKIRMDRAARITGGDPYEGRKAIERYGCGTCHTIPGIRNATALVCPDLTRIRARTYIAGVIENRPENMARWIMQPHAVDEKTAMPTLGVTETDAKNITAYLYSLE